MSIQHPQSNELEPWVVFSGEADEASLALWRIAEKDSSALAIFSSQDRAENYAAKHCTRPHDIRQLRSAQLIRVFIDCFRSGIQYAALNPNEDRVEQLFLLRQVLQAAREHYRDHAAR